MSDISTQVSLILCHKPFTDTTEGGSEEAPGDSEAQSEEQVSNSTKLKLLTC